MPAQKVLVFEGEINRPPKPSATYGKRADGFIGSANKENARP